MDYQHGILMDTLNDLRSMLLHGADRGGLRLQLERLIELTKMHFRSEEQLLQQQGFPGTEEHRKAHHNLLTRLYSAIDRVNRDEDVRLNSLLDFLPSWYIEHVEQLDQPYGAWLNDHGVF